MATTVSVGATADLGKEGGDRFMRLLAGANAGDEGALGKLRPIFDAVPALAAELGDLTQLTKNAWIDRITGEQLALAETLRRKARGMRAELAAPADGPLEGLLADRIVVCWLHLPYAESAYATQAGRLDREWADAYQRRIDRSHRRYLQAIRTLAQVRRLAVTVQIKVAEQQVNQVNTAIRTVA